MTGVLNHADKPAVSVTRETTVFDAVRLMVERRIGAVVVAEHDRAVGMFSERDVMAKVVFGRLDPLTTKVGDIMTAPVLTASASTTPQAAMSLMRSRHIRHLPVVADDGCVLGMLSIRHLLQDEIEELKHEVDSLEAYMAFDGAGG